jgi:glucose-1-phosphate thymidylyltransferase
LKAVVLAAGEGTRLRPFTVSRPKVMIPVGNRPILEYVVSALVDNGVRDIVLVVGYRKERIMSHFADGKKFGAKITYAVQEKQRTHSPSQRNTWMKIFLSLPGTT